VWLIALVGILAAQVTSIISVYETQLNRVTYASVTSSSLAARIFGTPDGTSVGAITMVEIFSTAAILTALMSIFGVVRHTRQNEETGRLELVGATSVGRNASLAAAMIVMTAANIVLFVASSAILIGLNLPTTGALMMAASISGVGLVFSAVAALTSQLASTARSASGLAGIVLGVAFLLRAAGATIGDLRADKLGVIIAWPSWLSPLGWGELMYPFTTQDFTPLILYPIAFVLFTVSAVYLSSHRDLGQGLLPQTRGRAGAHPLLLSPLGLAVRLQRVTWISWAVGAAIYGLTTGAFVDSIDDLLKDNELAQSMFTAVGGESALRDNYFALMTGWLAVMTTGFTVQSVLRLRSEETSGHAESMLATATSRGQWIASHGLVSMVGSALLMLVVGGTAAAATVATTSIPGTTSDLMLASIVQVPAILLISSVTIFAFSVSSRAAPFVGWGALAICVLTLMGNIFRLPDVFLKISPFAHVPLFPAEEIEIVPMLTLIGLSIALCIASAMMIKRRDVS
jgi:ABC-2 type transport system permease protein